MKGLIIKDPWITKILNGEKVWEIRGSNTKHRGHTELIKSTSGLIFGSGDLVRTMLLPKWGLDRYYEEHRLPTDYNIAYQNIWAWIFENVSWHPDPIPYKHPQGAVIWVNL